MAEGEDGSGIPSRKNKFGRIRYWVERIKLFINYHKYGLVKELLKLMKTDVDTLMYYDGSVPDEVSDEVRKKFNYIMRQCDNPFIVFGRRRPQSKERELHKMFNSLKQYLSESGVFIGQSGVKVERPGETIESLLRNIRNIVPLMLESGDMRQQIGMQLRRIREIANKQLEFPNTEFKYRILKSIDGLQSRLPVQQVGGGMSSRQQQEFGERFEQMCKYIGMLLDMNADPEYMENLTETLEKKREEEGREAMMEMIREVVDERMEAKGRGSGESEE